MRTTMTTRMSARIAIVRVFTEPPDEMVYRPSSSPVRGHSTALRAVLRGLDTIISASRPAELLRAVTFGHLVDPPGELEVRRGHTAG